MPVTSHYSTKKRIGFNVWVTKTAIPVKWKEAMIGYVWEVMSPLCRIDPSQHRVARRYPRWAGTLLDSTQTSRNSRTYGEAVRVMRSAIARRVKPHTGKGPGPRPSLPEPSFWSCNQLHKECL